MSRRIIFKEEFTDKHGTVHTVKVFRDSDWDEYQVDFYVGKECLTSSRYHTTSKDDAIDTAKLHLSVVKGQLG